MTSNLFADGRWQSASTLAKICAANKETFAKHRSVLVLSASGTAFSIAISLCRALDLQLFVAPSGRSFEDVEPHLRQWGITLIVREVVGESLVLEQRFYDARRSGASGIVIFTSGSTGVPKLVQHSWDTICASERFVPQRLAQATWFLAYEPGSYAGLQVYFSALGSGGKLIIPAVGARQSHARTIAENAVGVISGTPTWWKMLINGWPAETPRPMLLQATLGGESVSQRVIDLVDEFFSPSVLTHIYASTEAGTAIVVSDGKEGFPTAFLSTDGRVGLRVREGILEVRSNRTMQQYLNSEQPDFSSDGWLRTKDRVEIRGDRCFFVGREDGLINVGGMKLMPEEIEFLLAQVPGVRDCAVYARRNPVTGVLLVADVVADGLSAASIRTSLSEKLPAFKVPQHIRFVDKLAISDHGKKIRT